MAQRTIPITNWHPFAQRFPLLEGDEWTAFVESIRATNGPETPVTYRMVDGRREWLDGRNRVKASEEIGIEYKTEEVEITDEDVKEYILRRNVYRRHMTPELRRELVADLRADGMSGRRIAETLGVSHTTVMSDIKDIRDSSVSSGVKNFTPDDSQVSEISVETVVGKDGKTYPARRPTVEREPGDDTEEIEQEAAEMNGAPKAGPILCERCQRVGAVKRCSMCAEIRKAAKPPGEKKPKKKKADAPAPLDPYGVEIPKRCRDAFADPWIQESIDYLSVAAAKFWETRLADGMEKRKKRYPFFKPQDFIDGYGFAGNYLDQLLDHLKTMRPAAVCPSCSGTGCGECQSSGLVPQAVYKKLKGIT